MESQKTPKRVKKAALTPKRKKFARVYLDTGNASEAYRQAYNTNGKLSTINREAHKIKTSDAVQQELERLCKAAKLTDKEAFQILGRNMRQTDHLPSSVQSIGQYMQIKGYLKNGQSKEKQGTQKVAFIVHTDQMTIENKE